MNFNETFHGGRSKKGKPMPMEVPRQNSWKKEKVDGSQWKVPGRFRKAIEVDGSIWKLVGVTGVDGLLWKTMEV